MAGDGWDASLQPRGEPLTRTKFRRSTVAASLLGVIALANIQAGALIPAEASAVRSTVATQSPVAAIEDSIARELAVSLTDPAWRAHLRSAVVGGHEVDLQAITSRVGSGAGLRLAPLVATADRQAQAAKGLASDAGSLLRIRLGAPSMLEEATLPWVAAASSKNEAATITAYDSRGQAHTLDARHVPRQPVYVVDLDVSKALSKGLDVLRRELASKGLKAPEERVKSATASTAGWWASLITAVEVSDDKEPWFKGDAEMFTLVTGFDLDGKPTVNTVTMPYLANEGIVYRPNQILVNWSTYKYNLADAVMMEDDGGTNYQTLAQALTAALLTITDNGAYQPLVDAVIAAIPNDWWTDDPDFVEAWYTLAKDDSGRRYGAAGNGWMDIAPYFVSAF
jgi:hypothetical protein